LREPELARLQRHAVGQRLSDGKLLGGNQGCKELLPPVQFPAGNDDEAVLLPWWNVGQVDFPGEVFLRRLADTVTRRRLTQ
jgi:hypothetical protein